MENLNFKYLDLYCDYGACLWIEGGAVHPEKLPISESLCQRINAFCDDYFNALYEESDEWWENHEREEIEIAKLLQKELPTITVRVFSYNAWIPLEIYLYEIEITEGFENGANFLIGACKSEDNKNDKFGYSKHLSKTSGITLDEVFAFPYVFWFLEKYFEQSIQNNDDEYIYDEFNWWGENYYTYENVNKSLSEIKEIVFLLSNRKFHLKKVIEWKRNVIEYGFHDLFLRQFGFSSEWYNLDYNGKENFVEKYCGLYINFYTRFIHKMEKMMRDNPDCDLICFSGP